DPRQDRDIPACGRSPRRTPGRDAPGPHALSRQASTTVPYPYCCSPRPRTTSHPAARPCSPMPPWSRRTAATFVRPTRPPADVSPRGYVLPRLGLVLPASLLCGVELRGGCVEAARVDRDAIGVHGRIGEVCDAVLAHAVGQLEHQWGDDLLLRRGQLSPVRQPVHTCPICRRGTLEVGSVRLGLKEMPRAVAVGPV